MNAQALENLKLKIAGVVGNCELDESVISGSDNWSRIENLGRLIARLKPEWISERQGEMLICNLIYSSVNELSRETKLNGRLAKFVDVVALTEHMLGRISGLPYEYKIYYELPNFSLPNGSRIDIGNEACLELLSDNFVKGPSLSSALGVRSNTETCYFCTKVTGYCDYDPSAETPQESLKMFKVFVERGKSSNVLMTNFFLGWWGEREAKPIIYIHEIEGVDPGRVISYSVSKDIAQVLTTLQLGHDLEVGTNAQEAFANGMRGFLKLTSRRDVSLARVIAACEWSFDSDSEHVSAMKVVKVCIGLESIYGEDNSEGGLTKSLSDRCAYSLANDVFERKRIMKNCRELYKVRSSIVHGVKRKLSAADSDLLKFGMEILTGSIDKEVTLLPD